MNKDPLTFPSKGKVFRALLIVLLPILIWSVWFAANYRGLATAEGLHFAQLSRNLAEGRGWVTYSITPLGLHDVPQVERHPELWRAPLYALWQATLFWLVGSHGKVAAVASGLPWILLMWLSYLFARRIANPGVSLLIFLLMLLNPVLLNLSINGTPHTLAALLLLAYFRHLYAAGVVREQKRPADQAVADRVPGRLIVRTAIMAALIALTDYDLALPAFLLGLAIWLFVSPWSVAAPPVRRRSSIRKPLENALIWIKDNPAPKVAALFCVVYAGATSPWWIRNARLTGDPFYSLHQYSVLTQTSTYPGQSVYRTYSDTTPLPEVFILTHPREMAAKITKGVHDGMVSMIVDSNLLVFVAFICLMIVPAKRSPQRILMHCLVLLAVLHLLAVAAREQDPNDHASLIPLFTVFGLAGFWGWLQSLYPPLVQEKRHLRGEIQFARPSAPIIGTVLALLIFSLFGFVGERMSRKPIARLEVSPNVPQIASEKSRYQAILSACPWVLAWQGDVPCIWMPGDRDSLTSLQQKLGSSDVSLYFPRQRALPTKSDDPPAIWLEWIRHRVSGPAPQKNLSKVPREYLFAGKGDR